MKSKEREALRKRMDSKGWWLFAGTAADQLLGYIAWEIDRKRRRAKAHIFCHDCGGEVISDPVLCEECVARRDAREDKRKISTWRRT